MENAVRIDLLSKSDKIQVLDLLSNAELPIEDLTDEKMKNFIIAKGKDDIVIGVVGVEMYKEKGYGTRIYNENRRI